VAEKAKLLKTCFYFVRYEIMKIKAAKTNLLIYNTEKEAVMKRSVK